MMMERRLKILMIGSVTLLCGFIVAGNIHDPGTNLLFVQHVFSMDTIIPVSAMADHALSIPLLWRIGFWWIVAGEGLTAALFALGAVELFRAVVWFIGFLAVGGEWFAMWQSQVWDGQPAAFRFIASILLVLIFVAQADAEL